MKKTLKRASKQLVHYYSPAAHEDGASEELYCMISPTARDARASRDDETVNTSRS